VWWAADAVNGWRTRRPDLIATALFAMPVLATIVLWWIDLRTMRIGGCSSWQPVFEVRLWLRSVFGVPAAGFAELAAAGAVLVAASELKAIWREDLPRALFFGVATFVAPPAVLLGNPECFVGRYLFVSTPFLLMLFASRLSRCNDAGGTWRAVAAAVALVYVGGNAAELQDLIRVGRGRYGAAISFIATSDDARVVNVAGDHDFRDGLVFRYHAHHIGASPRVRYIDRKAWDSSPPVGS
jgi:hypothetical protein